MMKLVGQTPDGSQKRPRHALPWLPRALDLMSPAGNRRPAGE